MILVDTSIWIDHLHSTEPDLVARLGQDEVGCHPAVIEELALGSIKSRAQVLTLLGELTSFPTLASSARSRSFLARACGRGTRSSLPRVGSSESRATTPDHHEVVFETDALLAHRPPRSR